MKSTDEKAFLRIIAERPFDAAPRLVYADWLEERGDQRAEEIRQQCRYRLPITAKEMQRISAIAAARAQASADQVLVAVDAENPVHAVPEDASLDDDLDKLSVKDIARNFPRDEKGRLQLKQTVLLTQYPIVPARRDRRELWLAAKGPDRRSDPQVIRVELNHLFGENHVHNWSRVRWWWERGSTSTDDVTRWGISAAALRAVTSPHGGNARSKLEAKQIAGKLDEFERIALCTAWQDDGRFEDALQLCGIEYPEELSRMLNGEAFVLYNGCCEPGNERSAMLRGERMRAALWHTAPWRFAQTLADAQTRLDEWRAAKRGRPQKTPQLRFFTLPGSSHHARKPGLTLVPGKKGKPQLDFIFTASNAMLPESAWMRPLELDIARFGTP